MSHTPHRRLHQLRWKRRKTNTSQREFPRQPLGMTRRTRLRKQSVRLCELALRGFHVSDSVEELGTLDVYMWSPALSAGLFNKPQHLIEESLNRLTSAGTLEFPYAANVRNCGFALL